MEEQSKNRKRSAADQHASLALRGIAFALIAGLASASSAAVVKYLNNIYPGQLFACIFWYISSSTLPQIIWKKKEIFAPPSHRVSVFIAAFINATGSFLAGFASRYLPLGEAVVLYGSTPVFVTIAAKIFLKESFGILHLVALLMTIAGLILTSDLHQALIANSFETENIYGVAAGLGALASLTTVYILWRKMKQIHYSVLMFNSGILGVIEMVIVTAFLGNFTLNHNRLERGFIILLGFLGYLASVSPAVSLRYLEAGPATILKCSSNVFFAFLLQYVIFGEAAKPGGILGAVLVCISITFLGFGQKYGTSMPNKCLNLF